MKIFWGNESPNPHQNLIPVSQSAGQDPLTAISTAGCFQAVLSCAGTVCTNVPQGVLLDGFPFGPLVCSSSGVQGLTCPFPLPPSHLCSLHPFGKLHLWGCTTQVLCAISIYTEMTHLAQTLASFLAVSGNMWTLLCSFDMFILKSIKQRGRG